MQAAGVAPAEVATVALCVIAGGEAAVCATLLAASTVITVVAAGPILSLLGASVTVSSAGLLGNLAVVIALPLAAGVALRTAWSPGSGLDAAVRLVTVLALLLLLWQVASQIRLDSAYVQVIVALVVYVAGSAVLGGVLALRAPAGQATAVLLPVAMRDFAVAAGIATAAFGPAAAAPLGAYGVLVLLAGSVVALTARRRQAADNTGPARPGPLSALLARPFGTHRRPLSRVTGVRRRLHGPPRQVRVQPPRSTLMSTRLAALRAEAAASSAPVTASPCRLGLPASATWRASCATRAPISAISSGTTAAPRSASRRWPASRRCPGGASSTAA